MYGGVLLLLVDFLLSGGCCFFRSEYGNRGGVMRGGVACLVLPLFRRGLGIGLVGPLVLRPGLLELVGEGIPSGVDSTEDETTQGLVVALHISAGLIRLIHRLDRIRPDVAHIRIDHLDVNSNRQDECIDQLVKLTENGGVGTNIVPPQIMAQTDIVGVDRVLAHIRCVIIAVSAGEVIDEDCNGVHDAVHFGRSGSSEEVRESESDVVLADFIPVRFGVEGYFYALCNLVVEIRLKRLFFAHSFEFVKALFYHKRIVHLDGGVHLADVDSVLTRGDCLAIEQRIDSRDVIVHRCPQDRLDYSQVSGHAFRKNLSRSSCLGLLPV